MLEMVEVAALVTVQDVVGRSAWRRFGVPMGGAVDPFSVRLANRLVGNPDEAAVLEVVGGAVLRWARPGAVAVTGGLTAAVGGVPMASDAARLIPAGGSLRLASGAGLRGYVAVPGGLAAEVVLGSRATDLRTGFGGLGGRALRAGDRLQTAPAGAGAGLGRWTGTRTVGPVRVVPGPHATPEVLEALTAGPWRVASAADRTGIRLGGRPVDGGGEVDSIGLLPGAVQVPPDGVPIVMLADGPVTGGYPVPACVIGADLGRVAQGRPGDPLRLAVVSEAEARDAWRRTEDELAAIEPLDAAHGDELAWIGSHE